MRGRSACVLSAWVTLLLALPVSILRAQAPVVLKTETRTVLVDAVVTGKKGEYVKDLTAKDFHVWQDNKEQTIQSLALESAKPATAEVLRSSYLVLVFDYANMDAAAQLRARQSAGRFIDANTGPEHQIALAAFDGGFHIMQGFTGNAGRLKDAIAAKPAASINSASAGTRAAAELGSRDMFRSLRDLAAELSQVPGRKTIVLMTGGLTLTSEQKQAMAAAIDACNKSNVAIYPIDLRDPSAGDVVSIENGTASTRPVSRAASALSRVEAAPRGDDDTSAAIDPGGANQQALYALATGTGGFVIRNAAELPDGLQKIGQEQEEYYVLGYDPPPAKDGGCHSLRVKVDRPGTTVRARSSYCTGKAQDLLAGTSTEKNLESRAAASQAGNAAASMALPFFYIGPNLVRVSLALEISPAALKFEHKGGVHHAEINFLGIATSADGDEGAHISDSLDLDFPDAEFETAKLKPQHVEKEFMIASGQYDFTLVFSSGGESFGKLAQRLVIEPYQAGQLALSGIALGKAIQKPSNTGASLFDDRTRLIAGGMQLLLSGSSVFTKPEQAFCYFEVYAPEGSSGTVAVRLVDAKTGDLKWDGGSSQLAAVAGGKSAIPVGLGLPVASLAQGGYRLEVTVSGEAGKSVKHAAGFEVK